MRPLNLAVLASGRGTNLQAIIDSIEAGALDAKVVAVLSDRPEPLAFRRAREHGIPVLFVDPAGYRSREAYDAALVEALSTFRPDTVVLAGFMRIVTPVLLEAFPRRVVNIHPALLPAFPGLNAQAQAIAYGVRYSGCTVHFVDEGMDTGPVILQSVVPVYQDDTPETLAERILAKEHKTYPAALQLLAEGRLQIRGRRVVINWDGRVPRKPRDCVLEWQKIKDIQEDRCNG